MTQTLANNFSARFNLLCDHAGFVAGRGRQTEVYRFFGVSQVTARNWLIEGFCPRHETLQKIIKRLDQQNRLPKDTSPKVLHLWLEKGDSYIPNPLVTSTADSEGSEHCALNTYKIFRIVSGELDGLGINIDSLPVDATNSLLTDLCNEKLNNMSRSRANKIVSDRFSTLAVNSQ